VEHPRETIERSLTGFDIQVAHVVPGDGDAKCRPSFAARAGRGGETRDAVAPVTAVPFCEVEGDGGESPTELVFEVPVTAPDARHHGPKDPDGFE